MPDAGFGVLTDSLTAALVPHGFRSHQRRRMADYGVVAFWRRCTLSTNRAVALVRAPEGEFEIGPYCQWLKWRLMWLTRFVPLFYEVGLQIVLYGPGLAARFDVPEPFAKYADASSNQFVVLQSLFAVDTDAKLFACARTWGQVITGPVQDSIARTLKAAGFEPRET